MAKRIYTDEQKERRKAYAKAWKIANPKKVKEDRASWQLANPEKARASRAKWARLNLEKEKQRQAQWRKANPELVKVHRHTRRARIKGNGGELSKDIIQRLMLSQQGLCVYCHVDLNEAKYHLDHIMPLAKGGTNDDENVQLLCPTCNMQKGAKDPIEFAQSKGLLV